ncbi:hypothetical protein HGG70_05110 [Rhodobacteraceae bacterium R_SAG4]|nr:hypothetical protein [Rhodobacteraceae bacterium R_SAG4]
MDDFDSRCVAPYELIGVRYLRRMMQEADHSLGIKSAMKTDPDLAAHAEAVIEFSRDIDRHSHIFGDRHEYVRFWMLSTLRVGASRAQRYHEEMGVEAMKANNPQFGMF